MAQKMAFLTCTTASLRSVGDDLEEKILRKLNGWLYGGRNVLEINKRREQKAPKMLPKKKVAQAPA